MHRTIELYTGANPSLTAPNSPWLRECEGVGAHQRAGRACALAPGYWSTESGHRSSPGGAAPVSTLVDATESPGQTNVTIPPELVSCTYVNVYVRRADGTDSNGQMVTIPPKCGDGLEQAGIESATRSRCRQHLHCGLDLCSTSQ